VSAAPATIADAAGPHDAVLPYVRAAAALLELPLDPGRAQRVAGHLARTAAMARMLDDAALGPEDEPAAIYCPATFPAHLPPPAPDAEAAP
jgi:hypothetical protein